MTILRHELRQGWKGLAIWTGCIGFFVVICVLMYPQMEQQMSEVNAMFASMGAFTAAFGMDRLNFGTLTGFYAVECGNILGIGGALYAAMTGAGILSKEEQTGTAEFLLTHPVTRCDVTAGKLAALMLQILILNVLVYGMAIACVTAIGDAIPWKELTLLHLAYLLVQVELGGICFGISAFCRRGSLGVGMGLAIGMYFVNILANITEEAEFLKYITPYGYAEGADILAEEKLNAVYVLIGLALCAAGILTAFWQYRRKDIR
ncbi:MAG: ABC transporter permease subunit [Candidatus Faecousia sp.]|nr:ABC transporter permease [Clostridiales bacterium]MDY6179664.1 ABC transporter permease subunit [Candidatus Faecousia sp.]